MPWLPTVRSEAISHPRDILAETLVPVLRALSADTSTGHDGLDARLVGQKLSADGSHDADAAEARIRLLFDAPERLMVEVALPSLRFIICRNGQSMWAAPRATVEPIIHSVLGDIEEESTDTVLPPMSLPLDATAMKLLPALLDVRYCGSEDVDGLHCRVLEARVTQDFVSYFPESNGWRCLAWISDEPARLVRMQIVGPLGAFRLNVSSLKTSLAIPDHVWSQPEGVDAISVPAAAFGALGSWLAGDGVKKR